MATTTNIALTKPTINSTGWGAAVNTNFDDIDTLAGAKFLLQTANAKVPNAQILGALSNGLLKVAAVTGVISTAIPGTDYYATGLSVIPIADGGTGISTTPTNGQILIGNGTGYTLASLTAGAGITITPGVGSITIADTGSATAGGANTQVQYNSLGSLAGDSGMVYNALTDTMTLGNLVLTTPLPITEGGTGAITAAAARTNLGLGTMAVQNANAVAITGGIITGITPIAIAEGGTGAADAASARTALGLGNMAVQTASGVAITGGSITGITDLLVTDGGLNSSTIPLAGQIPMGTGAASYAPAHITAGTGISILNGASSITISSTDDNTTASNIGVGTGEVFKQETGSNLEFRTLLQGAGVTITTGANEVTIAMAAGAGHTIQDEGTSQTSRTNLNFVGAGVTVTDGGAGPDSTIVTISTAGEANTASNVGAGEGVFRSKTGVDLAFKTLTASGAIVLTSGANTIDISTAPTVGEANTASNLGAGEGVWVSKVGVDLRFKSLVAGNGILLSSTATEITVASTATGRSYTYALMGG